MANKNAKVPALRFKGFEGEWEVKKLGEVAAINSGGTPSRTNHTYWDGEIPWITTSLIDFNVIRNAVEKITTEGLKNSSAKLFPKGSVLMAMYGQGKTRGKVAVLGIEAATNQACASIISNDNILNSLFLYQNLSKRYDEIRELSNQGGQENLSGTIIKKISLFLPSLLEQKRIADFLSLIDERIQAQSKIIENYRLLKEYIVDRLFSKEVDKPLRFSGFSEEWKEYAFGDLLTVSTKKNSDNSIQNVLSASQSHGMIQRDEINIDIKYDEKSTKSYKVVELGDYVIHLRSFQGGFAFSDREGICSPAYTILKPKPVLEYAFLKEFFTSLKFIDLLKLVTYGIRDGRSINVEEFLKLRIYLPSNKEQEKIKKFITALNQRANYDSRIYHDLLLQKQYLLRNLFI